MTEFTFNPETHEYFVDGIKYPGVTDIIKAEGVSNFDMVNPAVLEAARDFGKKGHKMIEFWNLGKLNEDKLSAPLKPYLESWKQFVSDYKVEIIAVETKLYSKIWRYAGTLDVVAKMKGLLSLIDVKFSKQLYSSVDLQTGGYAKLWEDNNKEKIKKRYCVRPTEKRAKVDPLTETTDTSVFLSALQMYRWKERKGLL